MSRADPLAPLIAEEERDRHRKERNGRIARTSLAWFMTLLMLGWVSKYAFRMLWGGVEIMALIRLAHSPLV